MINIRIVFFIWTNYANLVTGIIRENFWMSKNIFHEQFIFLKNERFYIIPIFLILFELLLLS